MGVVIDRGGLVGGGYMANEGLHLETAGYY